MRFPHRLFVAAAVLIRAAPALGQAYVKYRGFLMADSISSSNPNDTIRQMNPGKVDWATAYKWW